MRFIGSADRKLRVIISTMKPDYEKHFPLKSRRFYSRDAEKTLANWFVYELSNGFYVSLAEKAGCSARDVDEEIAEYAISIARDIMRQVRNFGGLKGVKVDRKIIEAKKPGRLSLVNNREIEKALNSDLREQFGVCKACPTHCVYNPDGACYMFDGSPY
jgi:hypothetical protein